ncbi:degenerin mec-10-like [Argiope bruennichi]|nr:degenerin mec-10-like [Argiope bruennichi]
MNETERRSFGMNTSMFMKNCSFNGKYCTDSRLSYFTDFRFGNCITFNKQKLGIKPLRTSETGFGSGLKFDSHADQGHYQAIQHTVGFKLIIHNPMEIPSPEEDGVFINPGFEVFVSLKQIVNIRLPAPFKDDCMNYASESNGFKNKKECIRKCIQSKSYEKCGCIDQSLGVMNHLKQCDFRNVSESCCLDEVLDNMTLHGNICNCPLPCFSVSYNEKLSEALLVSRESGGFRDFMRPFIKNNYVKLNVFYSSLERRIYQQHPKFEESEFLSYIGNELSLWLGMSLMIVCEIFERLMLLLKSIIR